MTYLFATIDRAWRARAFALLVTLAAASAACPSGGGSNERRRPDADRSGGCGSLAEGESRCTSDWELEECERGEIVLYECVEGAYCDEEGGIADCYCDNVEDGVCPDGTCTEDPDCAACTPQCDGRECGDNGCGSTCGSCSSDQTCDAGGQCVEEGGSAGPWRVEFAATSSELRSVGATSAFIGSEQRAYAVGANALLIRNNSGQWVEDKEFEGPHDHAWFGLWVSSTGVVPHAVSGDGKWATRDSLGWQVRNSGSLGVLTAVAGVEGEVGEAWLVGTSGTIYRVQDSSIGGTTSPTSRDLYGVWAGGLDTAFAVGEDGTILGWDGQSWEERPSPVTNQIVDIAGSSATNLWAVSLRGEVLHRGPSGFFELFVEQPPDMSGGGIWANDDHVWVVGADGAIVHWDGQSWTAEDSGTADYLFDVYGREARFGGVELWAVGQNGTILYRDPGSSSAVRTRSVNTAQSLP